MSVKESSSRPMSTNTSLSTSKEVKLKRTIIKSIAKP